MPPYTPPVSSRSPSVDSGAYRRFDATDHQYPRSTASNVKSFVRGIGQAFNQLAGRTFGATYPPSGSADSRGAAHSIYNRGREIQAGLFNAGDRFSQFLLRDRFKEAIALRDLQAVQRGLQQGVSLRHSSSIGGESWGHRIARLNPYSSQARQIMWLILGAHDLEGHQVDLGQGDHKLRTPAHFGAASNNKEFFAQLIAVANHDPFRDLGIDAVDYKGRTCDQLTNHPEVRAQINEIRRIQVEARARFHEAEHRQQTERFDVPDDTVHRSRHAGPVTEQTAPKRYTTSITIDNVNRVRPGGQ